MKSLLATVLLLAPPVLANEGAGPYTFKLPGKAFDERCLQLAAGESIRYRFRASAPVDFNIHYHRGKDVFFPVQQSGVKDVSGSFKAETAEGYCLMWEHKGSELVSVEGTLELGAAR